MLAGANVVWAKAKTKNVKGEVSAIRYFKKESIGDNYELGEKHIVKTASESGLDIELPDGSRIDIGANSRIKMSAVFIDPNTAVKNASQVIELYNGAARFMVKKKKSQISNFLVKTPVAVVAVRGTDFIVKHVKKKGLRRGASSIYVLSGKVSVQSLRFSGTSLAKPVVLQSLESSDVSSNTRPTASKRITLQKLNLVESAAGLKVTTEEQLKQKIQESIKNSEEPEKQSSSEEEVEDEEKSESINKARNDEILKALEDTGVSTSKTPIFNAEKLNETILKRRITKPLAPPTTP